VQQAQEKHMSLEDMIKDKVDILEEITKQYEESNLKSERKILLLGQNIKYRDKTISQLKEIEKKGDDRVIELNEMYQNSVKENNVNSLHLKQMLKAKDEIILQLKAEHESISSRSDILKLFEAGESRETISKKLRIPMNKLNLILKFDQIKKEIYHSS
jgi:hypothetical protein